MRKQRYNARKRCYKTKIDIIDVEKIQLKKFYTFTLNKESKRMSIKQDIGEYLNIIRKYIHPYCKYVLYPEISKTGRIHYHGLIQFDSREDIFTFYYNVIEIRSAIEIDTIDDMDKWMDYCLKQKEYASLYKQWLLPYKIHNIPSALE